MWLLISVLELTVVSVLSLPYGYNNINTNAQVYRPVNFEARESVPYGNNDVKISHTLSTVNKEYGLMHHLTPPPISKAQNYYLLASATTQIPFTTQSPRQYYINPAIVRQQYLVPNAPRTRTNYQSHVVTSTPLTQFNTIVPTIKPHNDLEHQNTQNYENKYDESDEDDDNDDEYPQKHYEQSAIQKQKAAHGNDPRDPKIQKTDAKLPERKDRIDFQIYGFDGPKSYKFGYDTGKGENRQFRYETRDRDGNVSGRYGYVDRAGKLNVVKYTSNADDGFRTETL